MLVNELIKKINEEIKNAQEAFEADKSWTVCNGIKIGRIYGKVDALVMITGKDYIVTKDGLIER